MAIKCGTAANGLGTGPSVMGVSSAGHPGFLAASNRNVFQETEAEPKFTDNSRWEGKAGERGSARERKNGSSAGNATAFGHPLV